MYQDSLDNEKANYQNSNNGENDESYGKFEAINDNTNNRQEDEDVRELKQLQKANKNGQLRRQNKNKDDIHWTQTQGGNKKTRKNRKQKEESKRSDLSNSVDFPEVAKGVMIYSERKPVVKTDSTQATSSTEQPTETFRGQKEEFQMRPATPVRHPFSGSVLAMMTNGGAERKRAPSVYDTLKHMLDIEKSLENVSTIF